METAVLNGALYAGLLAGGAANLKANIKTVNDLNVFPIPDGDTGDNMFLTIESGADSAGGSDRLDVTAKAAARGMLLGARGNSGVILSRIFAGLAKGLAGVEAADARTLGKAFESGVAEAYGAVSVPVEGTILTVLSDSVRFANQNLADDSTIESYLDDFSRELYLSLDRTPDLLDVLKEAGVVDSGGAGLGYIIEGMKNTLAGVRTEDGDQAASGKRRVDLDAFTEDSVLEFGYCTEFLLRLQRCKVDIDAFDVDGLRDYLNRAGDSVVCFKEGSVVKVHVHTMSPGKVFNHCQKFGEFLTVKVENMTLQHNENHMKEKFTPRVNKPHKQFGIVSVAAGEGIRKAFLEQGCDVVVDGGQSMNPSAENLISAFKEINADTIFVFPNNGNIILTANQAAALYKDAQIRVVPTKTIGEGYAAISMLDTTSGDADAIIAELEEVISGVVTAMVSRAVRDADMDGVAVKKDDYIGFAGDKILCDDPDKNTAAQQLCDAANAGRYDIMLLVCGSDVTVDEAQSLYASLQKRYRRTEIVMIDGGQPVYDYIIILE